MQADCYFLPQAACILRQTISAAKAHYIRATGHRTSLGSPPRTSLGSRRCAHSSLVALRRARTGRRPTDWSQKSLNPGDTSKLRRHPPTFRRRSADTLLTYPAHGPLTYLCRADVRRHPTDTILPRSCLTLRRHFADVRPLYFSIDCYQWLYICLAYIALSQPTPVGCCEKAVQPRKVLLCSARSNSFALPLHLRPISPSSLCLLKPPKLRAPPMIDALEFRKNLCYITRITRN